MNPLKIEIVPIEELKAYEKNAKLHPERQVQQIMSSIQQFGMNDPIGIDKDNVIIEGHGRYEALKRLNYTNVPCIRLPHLTGEQREAYILVHNKLTMNSDFDTDILTEALESIITIDMTEFDFELPDFEDFEEEHNERERTGDAYNLVDYDATRVEGFYQMPILKPIDYIPDDLRGFNYVLSAKEYDYGIHFYIDDYQFERVWNEPYFYIDKLNAFKCTLTPDFSLYSDMPIAMKIWNVYRSRLIGQMCQDYGMKVIPTISWAEPDTFEFCFDGIPKHSTISVSTIGVKRDEEAAKIWVEGMDEAMRRLEPKNILVYGGDIGYDFGKCKVKYYNNHVTERMNKSAKKADK